MAQIRENHRPEKGKINFTERKKRVDMGRGSHFPKGREDLDGGARQFCRTRGTPHIVF